MVRELTDRLQVYTARTRPCMGREHGHVDGREHGVPTVISGVS